MGFVNRLASPRNGDYGSGIELPEIELVFQARKKERLFFQPCNFSSCNMGTIKVSSGQQLCASFLCFGSSSFTFLCTTSLSGSQFTNAAGKMEKERKNLHKGKMPLQEKKRKTVATNAQERKKRMLLFSCC